MNEEGKKKVDESYKTQVNKERLATEAKASSSPKETAGKKEAIMPEASFAFFITTMAMQSAIALGDTENPADGKKEDNLPQAKFLIDTLGMLQEKTKNNLTSEESSMLEGILYELRMRYVQKSNETLPLK